MATATEIFRDYVVDGVPSSGANNPVKSDIRTWGTALENGIKGAHNADIPSATTLDLSAAAGELVDVTGTTAITAITLADGNVCTVRFTGALTLTNGASLVLPGATDILTVAGDFAIFRGYAAGVVRCVAYQRNDGKALVAPASSALVGAQMVINATIVESHSANAVTYSLKTLAGTDPTSGDPVKAYFRNATAGTGNYVERSITAALSLTVSSGSTLGVPATTLTPFKLWLVLFDDAGTVRLGIINNVSGTSIYPLGRFPIASSTAEGGAGAADSAQVFYTGTAVTSKPYIPLAYASYETGLTAAGTWDASPTRIQMFGPGVPLPGDSIQEVYTSTTTVGSTSSATFADLASGFTLAITPTSAANIIDVTSFGTIANTANNGAMFLEILRGSTAIGFPVGQQSSSNASSITPISLRARDAPGVTTSTTYKIQGKTSVGVLNFPATNSGADMSLKELMT